MGVPVKHRILYLDEIGRIDGAEVVLYNLVTNLDRDRFEPTVVCGSEGALVDKLRAQGIRVYVLKMKEPAKLMFGMGGIRLPDPLGLLSNLLGAALFGLKFYIFLGRNPADVVHTNSLMANLLGSIPARLSGKRLIWHEHNIQPPGFRRKVINIMARLFPHAVIAISDAVRGIYKPVPGGPRMLTVHNGIDAARFHTEEDDAIRDELGIPEGYKVVAITAVLRPWKGHKYFLLAAREVLRRYGKVKFLIVGDEVFDKDKGYKDELMALTRELGIEKDVIFTGFRQDIPRVLSGIDILVSASVLPEPFSLIVLEAMASAKPVVATNTGGVHEVVRDKETAILVEPADPVQLSRAILGLLEDGDAAKAMGRAGRKRAEKVFSIRRFVHGVESAYLDVMG